MVKISYPQENLDRHRVQVLLYASCNPTEKTRESIAFQVISDEGDMLVATVINSPAFSHKHGYRQGETYQIPKSQIASYTRSLKNFPI